MKHPLRSKSVDIVDINLRQRTVAPPRVVSVIRKPIAACCRQDVLRAYVDLALDSIVFRTRSTHPTQDENQANQASDQWFPCTRLGSISLHFPGAIEISTKVQSLSGMFLLRHNR